jgi:tetratricopeptide (TPR) repeat protein
MAIGMGNITSFSILSPECSNSRIIILARQESNPNKNLKGEKGMSENAGGSAGGGGYRFQASVTALLAVHMLVEQDLTDLINEIQEVPTAVSAETNGPGDDIRIEFSPSESILEFQVKHGLRVDSRFDEAFEKIADGLARNDTIRVILVVDQTSTKRIQEEFREDLERFRHGREDSLHDRELFDRVLQIVKKHVTNLDQARALIKRIFVRVMDFDKGTTGTLLMARTLLSNVIPDQKQARAAWDILVNDGLRLIQERGRVTSFDLKQLLWSRNIPFVRTLAAPKQYLWTVPYQRNLFFTGREDLLSTLHDQLNRMTASTLAPSQAMSGLGGIGKTQLAIEYAYRYREVYHDVLWVNAATSTTLRSDFISLARLLDLPEKDNADAETAILAVKRWFQEQGNWLLIIDNVDDLSAIQSFLPTSGKGHVLLTTRNHAVGSIANRVFVEKMSQTESKLLLLRRGRILDIDAPLETVSADNIAQAEKIAALLDGLPLALDQAGAYIEETDCGLEHYLRIYTERQADLLKRRGSTPTEHPESVTVTFSLCFQNVIRKNPAAGDLLRLCAFLSPDLIPEEIILKATTKSDTLLEKALRDPLEFDELIGALLRYSLVRRKAEGEVLSIHRLVQAVLKEEMTPEVRRFWAECAVRAVGAVFPKEMGVDVWGLCLRYLPHAQICMQLVEQFSFAFFEAAQLLHQTGYYLYTQVQYGEAELFLRHALQIERSIVSAEYLLATTEHELARICQAIGEYQEAEKLFQHALHTFEKVLGPEHNSTLVTLRNLGALYVDQGKYQEAEPLLREALAQRENIVGANHPSTAAALHQLAVLHQQQGKYQEAEQGLRRALYIYENTVGLEHPDTAATLHEMARLLATQKKYEQAKYLYLQVLSIDEKLLGPEHPSMADTLQALGAIYMQEEAYKDAEKLFKRSLALHEKTVGSNHPSYAGALQNLGVLYRKQGAYENASQILQQALKIFEEKLGSKHLSTGGTLHTLAEVCVYLEELDKAEQFYLHALAIFEQTLEPNHPYIADVRKKLAILRQGC